MRFIPLACFRLPVATGGGATIGDAVGGQSSSRERWRGPSGTADVSLEAALAVSMSQAFCPGLSAAGRFAGCVP